ncbi:5-oxoprolinase subunit PxpB [Hwangdonia lutea]|uniref:5-oxoprolinase subunit PxpB n=1 Tax=Hwangdonia lutea TaxID=3075823 RepID=A0AA97HR75_9FLAO|nr:5-oxoprolinase subunit PxpB [Hwangdonia sp. SCSIO 19198]WOD43128.1 5-oxoprolinase subunit PxpB [Hwangdonia sp. SCSIO 19198]
MAFNLVYKRFGERSVLIEWPSVINEKTLFDVLAFKDKILKSNIEFIVNINHAYNSLLITYENLKIDFESQLSSLQKIYNHKNNYEQPKFTQWHIPVCYDAVFGVDLEILSKAKNISKETIIEQHSQAIYTVYFIGFLPGFLYLGGLDDTLHFPRKETPRLKIEKGAVAIGGHQTGVYPCESPGGWNIIGNTPIPFFDVKKDNPCFATSGDRIKFYPISLKKHHEIKTLVDAGVYQLESEVVHG